MEEEKIDEKKRLHAAELAKKKKDFAKGNAVSGRDIFQFKPELANNDDEAGDAFSHARRNDDGTIIDEDVQMRELNNLLHWKPLRLMRPRSLKPPIHES